MNRMIAELLDFTRSRQGGIPVAPREIDIHEVVREVVSDLRLAHPNREVRLELTGARNGRWDADRVAQLCGNLVGNALEHSPASGGPVEVSVRETDRGIQLEVKNGGLPIPPGLLPILFEPFRHGGRPGSEGLGLGLYIAREIANAHGGSISVESNESGTRFAVRL